MIKYKNLNCNSDIVSYNYTYESITIRFKNGMFYVYTARKLNQGIINEMKALADKGYGLNKYIKKYVRKSYDTKYL